MGEEKKSKKVSVAFGRKSLAIGSGVADIDTSSCLTESTPYSSLNRILKQLEPVGMPADVPICCKGQRGDSIFIILNGEVEVSRQDQHGERQILASLGPGEFFGEFGFLTDGWRHADVTSKTPVRVIEITKETLVEAGAMEPKMMRLLKEYFHQRRKENELIDHNLLGCMALSASKWLAARAEEVDLGEGGVLLWQQDQGEYLYVVESGHLDVLHNKDDTQISLARLSKGDIIGEMALLGDGKHMATVQAASQCKLLRIHHKDIEEVLAVEHRFEKGLRQLAAERQKANHDLWGI